MSRSLKRRGFVKALAALPAAPALLAQQAAPAPPRNPQAGILGATPTVPKLDVVGTDVAADPVLHFFTPAQFTALNKLADLLQPAINGAPGALEAKAPEFLDFLLSESLAERQQIYRAGLDSLNAQAKKRFNKSFADVSDTEAAALLAPLREPWTYDPPKDPLARLLREAKADIRSATTNSREYNAAVSAGGGRRGGGSGLYWYPLD